MTNEERAKQLIELAYAAVRHSSEDVSMDEILEDGIAQALAEAEERGRQRGLEEAQGAVRKHLYSDEPIERRLRELAIEAIRALADAREVPHE